ncbi:hypothetical protein Poli38472_013788 [Pythium oligandrum]|uniref:MARVEL domain-containing protein n=1 Tax=Pythium oligandrum TaxID=41045 RepID=A0A8K1C232_PYTOL|nr:hypothetical protein Poli38472_013788 [Pythium oligandrum]|eukprot:TMW55026.1 hypothetical protein Poli38472_013788 [Pythium oligandrum]
MAGVHENVPIAVRCVIILLSIITFATGGAGHLRACTFGETHYNSHYQINFVIAVGVLICVLMSLRVALFDYKKRRLPSMKVQVSVDAVLLVLSFIAAITAALSPIVNDVCTGDNDMKVFIQEVCEFSCSKIVASVVMSFLMFVCFLVLILFTTKVIPVSTESEPAEDFSFGEVGTPRARKINQQSTASSVGEV